jgi:hypothetical protein
MALYIEEFNKMFGKIRYEWHIGERVPDMSRVVNFQADGDELNLFVQAMQASRGEHPRVDYQKMTGFTAKLPETTRKKQYRIWYTPNLSDGLPPGVPAATPTGIVRQTKSAARLWIDANPTRDGVWEFREENA